LEQSAGQVEKEGPGPKLTETGGKEAATTAAEQMLPTEETPEMVAPERFESPGEVASNAALGKVGTSGRITAASEGGLGAGPSEQPSEGISWAIVQPRVPEDFVRAEREEDEIWLAQLDLGDEMDTDIQCVLQLHWQEMHNVNRVGALPALVHFLLCLYVFC
jgi:hypothetical protein